MYVSMYCVCIVELHIGTKCVHIRTYVCIIRTCTYHHRAMDLNSFESSSEWQRIMRPPLCSLMK